MTAGAANARAGSGTVAAKEPATTVRRLRLPLSSAACSRRLGAFRLRRIRFLRAVRKGIADPGAEAAGRGSEQGGEAGQDHATADDGDGGQQLAGSVEEAEAAAVRGVGTGGGDGLPRLNGAGLGVVRQGAA